MSRKKVLFLSLKSFSATGGIEKVCKVAGKALYESTLSGSTSYQIHSMYDKQSDVDNNIYFPGEHFRGYGENKLKFIYSSVKEGCRSNTVILSHINLLPIAWVIKILSPRTKIFLIAHGIEIWGKLSNFKKKMLHSCYRIISVSNYTSDRIQHVHGIPASCCSVLNNCLDPNLTIVNDEDRKKDAEELRIKYEYKTEDKIIFTLTRLYSTERYKGYDMILEAMQHLIKAHPELRYLIAGKYDAREKEYVETKAKTLGLEKHLKLPGFIPDEDIATHFSMANIYAMPSRKEGFGIVFVEAMYYGLPVIAGNQDGSVDALLNGKLGVLVNPLDVADIENALLRILNNYTINKPDRKLLMDNFGYDGYKQKLNQLINSAVLQFGNEIMDFQQSSTPSTHSHNT